MHKQAYSLYFSLNFSREISPYASSFFPPFPFILLATFPTPLPTAPNPKLHPLILTLQTKKYTSAQLLTQNARKIPKSLHLSPALIFNVLR